MTTTLRPFWLVFPATLACSSPMKAPVDAGPSPTIAFNVVALESATGLADAFAYLEYRDGQDELETTDATGRVVFTSPSIASGVASVTAGTSGRIVISRVSPDVAGLQRIALPMRRSDGLSQDTDDLPIGPMLKISGPLTKISPSDAVLMQSSLPGTNAVLAGASPNTTYSMSVERGSLFTIFGVEYQMQASMFARGFTTQVAKWFSLEIPKPTDDTTILVDITALPAQTSTTATGKLVLPGGDAGPLGGASTAFVIALGDKGQPSPIPISIPNIGLTQTIDVSPDLNSFVYTVEYVPYPNVVAYTYAQVTRTDSSYSFRTVKGFPTNGQVLNEFEIPLTLSTPLNEGSMIDASAAGEDESVILSVGNPNGRDNVWNVHLLPHASSSVPRLPNELEAIIRDKNPTLSAFVGVYRMFPPAPNLSPAGSHGSQSATVRFYRL